jgi:hypothetical protein
MATNPFRDTEQRIATGGLAARLVRNADPKTDPQGARVHRLPRSAAPDQAEADGDPGEWLGRWAVLAMFGLTLALAGVFLALWVDGEPATLPSAAEEVATAGPAAAAPALPPTPVAPPASGDGIDPSPPTPRLASGSEPALRPPAAAIEAPHPPTERPLETAGLKLTPEEIRALLTHGDALLTAGDVAAARPLLEKAALAGDPTAALRLGQSYDPGYLPGAGLREGVGNLGLAIFWYRRGQELGNGTAAFLARKLETAARAEWRAISARPPAWRP